MTTIDMFQLGFFVGFWSFLFQLAVYFLAASTKKAARQYSFAKKMKAGEARCDAYFHCHCEKIGKHDKHVNETNMVVWE